MYQLTVLTGTSVYLCILKKWHTWEGWGRLAPVSFEYWLLGFPNAITIMLGKLLLIEELPQHISFREDED